MNILSPVFVELTMNKTQVRHQKELSSPSGRGQVRALLDRQPSPYPLPEGEEEKFKNTQFVRSTCVLFTVSFV